MRILMRTPMKRAASVLSGIGLVLLAGVASPLLVLGHSNVTGYPDNPNEMDTFPYYSRAPHLFTHPYEEGENAFSPTYSYDEGGTRYIDWYALENIDMRTLDFRVQLQANEDIFNWMEPVYLTATITGSDLNIFPELKWRVQGLGTIADAGSITVAHGVGRSTARQILPNPYITHLVFYLYFPSGQLHVSSHPIEIGNRPLAPRAISAVIESEGKESDEEGKRETVSLPQTSDFITATLVSSIFLVGSGAVFLVTKRLPEKSIKELKS